MTSSEKALLQIKDVYKYYNLRTLTMLGRTVEEIKAVRGVSLNVMRGETLGLVGESGCGKSTLSKLIVKLEKPLSGNILFEGKDIFNIKEMPEEQLRKEIQLIFQNPFSTLSPQMKIGAHIEDALVIHHIGNDSKRVREKALELFDLVGLPDTVYDSYPENLSGGATQRVNIARAMAMQPKMLISDEGISILDVSEQARILNLLRELQEQFHLSYIIVTHDLSVVRHISDRLAVMYLGKIVELGMNPELFDKPLHPYTRALIDAIPTIARGLSNVEVTPLGGEVPSPINLPPGCTFHPRCRLASEICAEQEPLLEMVQPDRHSACHHWQELE